MARNQYAGTCYRCGLPVAAGAGYFEKVRHEDRKPGDPAWRVQHCYRSHNGGVTCEMAAQTEVEKTKQQHKLETSQFGCTQ